MINANDVKELREITGTGFMETKKALEDAGGDKTKAIELLRQRGISIAKEKSTREVSQGLIESYIHNGKIGVLVEVNCETDFVAKNDEFKQMAKDICLHIASSNPSYIKREDVSEDIINEETRIELGKEDLKNKPENIKLKIVQGRVDKILKEKILMDQSFVKDNAITIKQLIEQKIAKFKENIVIKRFIRYELGK